MIIERISGSGAAVVNINRHLPEEFRDKFKCTRQDVEVNVIRLDIENKTYELIKHPSPLDYHWMFTEHHYVMAKPLNDSDPRPLSSKAEEMKAMDEADAKMFQFKVTGLKSICNLYEENLEECCSL